MCDHSVVEKKRYCTVLLTHLPPKEDILGFRSCSYNELDLEQIKEVCFNVTVELGLGFRITLD